VATPLRNGYPVTAQSLANLQTEFEQLYERRYGRGSSYRAAGIELVTYRLQARGMMNRLRMEPLGLGASDAAHAERGTRPIIIEETGAMRTVKVYDFERMNPGNVVRGPTVIHSPLTTVVVHSGQVARMDGLRNLVLEAA
jgi:N-methylhydantoinase A